jgi:N-methylhydantoinase A
VSSASAVAERGRSADRLWRIGVDVGGTFTDIVVVDSLDEVKVEKVPTVPADPAKGVIAALDRSAAAGLDLSSFLHRTTLFVHGSTIATNTVLEGKGAKVGLLTTQGFRDFLEIRRGRRDNPWDHRTPYPPALVPRHLRLPVRETRTIVCRLRER